MRTEIRACCALLAVLTWVSAVAVEALAAGRPNIILVLTDDQRFDSLGCMGNPIVKTPTIDRLAANGVLFENMFCTTSICAISRATVMTGQWERRHQINAFRTPLTAEQFANTFPAQLRKHGYRTGVLGKWGLGGPLPVDEYDQFDGYSGQGRYYPQGKSRQPGEHLTQKHTEQALNFLKGCSAEQPFLLQIYTKAAHCQDGDPWPFQPDVKYDNFFVNDEIPLPRTATEAHFRALPEFLQKSEARKRWFVRFATDELRQKSVKDYYRLIAGVDDLLASVTSQLKEMGAADNTVIIYTSDNGFYLGEHGLAGKWFMHEESIRLPLIVYDPRLPSDLRGKKRQEMVLNVDLAPTILDLAGVEIPDVVQGESLVPLLRNEERPWRQEFLYEHRFRHASIPMTEGVRTQRWKYTRYISVDPVYEELFDLENDPGEERNLAPESAYAERLKELREKTDRLGKQLE